MRKAFLSGRYTQIPLFPTEDGTVSVKLNNNSIAIVEF